MNLKLYFDGLVENYKFNLNRLLNKPGLPLSTLGKIRFELQHLAHWKQLTQLLTAFHEQSEEKKKLLGQAADQRTVQFAKTLGGINASIDDIVCQFSDCLNDMLNAFGIPFTDGHQDFYFWSSDAGENRAYIEADKQGSINYVAQASMPLFELILGPATYYKDTQEIKFEEKSDTPRFVLRDMLYPNAGTPPTNVPDLQCILWASLSHIFAKKAVDAVSKSTTKKPTLHVYLPAQINRDSNFWQCELPKIQKARATHDFTVKYYKYNEVSRAWEPTTLEAYDVVRMRTTNLPPTHPVTDPADLAISHKVDDAGKTYPVRSQGISFQKLRRLTNKWKVFAKDKERTRELPVLLKSIATLGKDHRVKNPYQEYSHKRHQDHELILKICNQMNEASIEAYKKGMNYLKKKNYIRQQLHHLGITQSTDLHQRNRMSVSAQLKLMQAYKQYFQYDEIISLYKETENKHLRHLPQAKSLYVWACNRAAHDLIHDCDIQRPGEYAQTYPKNIKQILYLLDEALLVCENGLRKNPQNKTFVFERARNIELRSQLNGPVVDAHFESSQHQVLKSFYADRGLTEEKLKSPSLDTVLTCYKDALFDHHVCAAGSKYMEYYAENIDSRAHYPGHSKAVFQQVAARTYDMILIDGLDECTIPAVLQSAFIAAYNLGDSIKLKRVMERMARVDMSENELGFFRYLKVCRFTGDNIEPVLVETLPEFSTILEAQRKLQETKKADAKNPDPYVTLMHRSYDYRQSLSDHAQGQKRGGNMQFGGALPQQVISKSDIDIFSKFISEKTIGQLIPSQAVMESFMNAAANGVNKELYDFLDKMLKKYYAQGTLLHKKLEQITDVNEVLCLMTDIVALNYKLLSNAADLNVVPYRDLDFAMKALCAVLGDETAFREKTYDSGTSLSIMYAMQVGDCRHHAETTQILFDIWKRKRMETLLDQSPAFEALEGTQLRVIDTKLDESVEELGQFKQLGKFDYPHTFNVLCTREPSTGQNKFMIYDAFILEQDPAPFEFEEVNGQVEFAAKNNYGRPSRFQFAPYTGDKGSRTDDVYGLSIQGFNGVSETSVTACIFEEGSKKQTNEQVNLIVKNEKIKAFKTSKLPILWEMLVEKALPFTFDNYFDIPTEEINVISTFLSATFPKYHQVPKERISNLIQVIYQYQPALYASMLKPTPAQPPQPQPISASLLLKILAHPATKVAAVVLIIAGIAGLAVGGLGLSGIAVGLSILLAGITTGFGAGGIVFGGGLFTAGFFASEKINTLTPKVAPTPTH